jgi:hypothetical protein
MVFHSARDAAAAALSLIAADWTKSETGDRNKAAKNRSNVFILSGSSKVGSDRGLFDVVVALGCA